MLVFLRSLYVLKLCEARYKCGTGVEELVIFSYVTQELFYLFTFKAKYWRPGALVL